MNAAEEQDWIGYAAGLLAFNVGGILLLYALQRLQAWLPLNPERCRPTWR